MKALWTLQPFRPEWVEQDCTLAFVRNLPPRSGFISLFIWAIIFYDIVNNADCYSVAYCSLMD